MPINSLNICQVNDYDVKGGAEKVSLNLHLAYSELKHQSNLIVGRKYYNYPNTYAIFDNSISQKINFINRYQREPFFSDNKYGQMLIRALKSSNSYKSIYYLTKGMDDYDQPSLRNFLTDLHIKPDILHMHNLHGNYFDISELPIISKEVPTILTLHDAWLFTGSCMHFMNCEKWITGCNNCNKLIVASKYRRYGVLNNWYYKKRIFEKCNLFVITPSQWLMDHVKKSILEPAIVDSKVIHNGIDMNIFHIGNKENAREILGLPKNAFILIFIANSARSNPSKDFSTLKKATIQLANRKPHEKIIFLVIGDAHEKEIHGSATIIYIPFITDEKTLVKYYQASDVYVHAAKADTFPTTIIEAMSCGLPIIATDVGGIPEQIHNENLGILTKPGDYNIFAKKIEYLLEDEELREKMGRNAAKEAHERYNFQNQVNNYLKYYHEILKRHNDR